MPSAANSRAKLEIALRERGAREIDLVDCKLLTAHLHHAAADREVHQHR